LIKKLVLVFWKIIKSKLFLGFCLGLLVLSVFFQTIEYTSTDQFCESCHVHPHVTVSWKKSTHFDNKAGMVVHCVECHLPPKGVKYYSEKARLGIKDIYGKIFKDEFNWDEKSRLEHAVNFNYKSACLKCHQNLFPLQLTKKGEEAHLHYSQNPETIRCLNCHLFVGHFSKQAQVTMQFGEKKEGPKEYFTEPAEVEEFENFSEFIPGSSVKFDMVAVQGGTFQMGSPESESFHKDDEGPVRNVTISPFWMGKTEVTWDEYQAFYQQTRQEGRTDTREIYGQQLSATDVITGATPPYGNPDQGWGKGQRPAITMTHHAATVYCEWISKVTGKKYRLPTEAEWEYACRAGTSTPYFFEGNPKDYTKNRFWNKIFGIDTSGINSFIIYTQNSKAKTQTQDEVKPNPFGLVNMLGNVREFCVDWYSLDVYANYSKNVVDPKGPENGEERVIRGGSFKSDASDVRSASRDFTRHDAWLVTDPQIPKSIWWYSDCFDVGFRVVCEYKEEKK